MHKDLSVVPFISLWYLLLSKRYRVSAGTLVCLSISVYAKYYTDAISSHTDYETAVYLLALEIKSTNKTMFKINTVYIVICLCCLRTYFN